MSIFARARSRSDSDVTLPLWVSGDLNAFFGLGFNVLVNVLVLTGLCLGVAKISSGDVYGVILPTASRCAAV